MIADKTSHRIAVIANPEFLKEGASVRDFMSPDRGILGGDDEEATSLLRALYAPFMRREDRILVMDAASAELTKYAANAMLATRVSFMNEIAALCEKIGANVEHVRHGVGADSRIGSSFLFPGTGFGGSCFPKDLAALLHLGERCGIDLRTIRATLDVNRTQKRILVRRAHTGALRNSRDARPRPRSNPRGRRRPVAGHRVERVSISGQGIRGLLRKPILFDGRNIWNRRIVEALGFRYHGIGV